MNFEIFKLVNGLAYKNKVLDLIMIFFSKYMPYIFMLSIAYVFIIGIKNNNQNYRKVAFNTFIFTVINLTINFVIGGIYFVDRPFISHKVNLLFPHTNDSSFPSDHATGTMSIALGVKKYNKLFSIILIILSLIVGFSRVYVGHHYPLDVVGAYIIVFITNYAYKTKAARKVEEIYSKLENKLAAKVYPEN